MTTVFPWGLLCFFFGVAGAEVEGGEFPEVVTAAGLVVAVGELAVTVTDSCTLFMPRLKVALARPPSET